MNYKSLFSDFAGKTVFVTGHTGFKGSWLTAILTELGANVVGFSNPNSNDLLFNCLGLTHRITHIEGDICDYQYLQKSINDASPDILIHLAAQAIVKTSYDDPLATINVNTLGSANILDIVRNSKSIRSFVYITSDKCYENNEWVWGYRETDSLGGKDPYSASKAAAEILFSSFYRSYFINQTNLGVASVRAGNVIGGGDWSQHRLVPDCIRSIQSSQPLRLRNPSSTRPWQHVLEPLSGYLLLSVKLLRDPITYSGSWNFGPSTNDQLSVADVTERIFKNIGAGSCLFDTSVEHKPEAGLLQLNCDKAHAYLDWSPRWDVLASIDMTSSWYKAYLDGEDISTYTYSQIYSYFPELL